MKVLMISFERKLFESGSNAASRMIEYGELFDELHVVVFSLRKHRLKEMKLSENVTIYPTDALTKIDYILNAYVIAKSVITSKPNKWVVSTQDPHETGLVGYLLKKKLDIRFHVQMHGDFWSPYFRKESFMNKVRLRIAHLTIPKADCIRVVSKRIKKGLKKSFNPSVPMSVLSIAEFNDIQKKKATFDVHKKYPQFDFIALMASRLERVKNIELALIAFQKIVKKHPKSGLIIAGDGGGRAFLEGLVLKLNLSKNVIFLGWQDDIVSYIKTADVFLNTSNHEGYCLTLIEAAQAKCPIITTDVGVVGEVLNEKNTLICPVGDVRCVESRLSIAIENKDKISKLGEDAFIDVISELPRKETYLKKYKESIVECI